jgi:hypothetical protein
MELNYYQSLVKTKRWIGNNPVTLKPGGIKKDRDYYATDKLDGLRRLLLFKDSKLYNISSKMEFQEFYLTKGGKTLDGTLIDCEFYKKKYYAFDILFSEGKDVRETNFAYRQEILKKALKTVKSKKLIAKEYLQLKCPEILKKIKEDSGKYKEGDLDGVIVAPATFYTSTVFKWKPSNLLSNDFKVRKTDGILYLLLQNGQVFERRGYPGIGKVIYSGTTIKDGDIVEFVFENGKFKPLRTRPDKTKSNHISVILDNFGQMTNPARIEKLFC